MTMIQKTVSKLAKLCQEGSSQRRRVSRLWGPRVTVAFASHVLLPNSNTERTLARKILKFMLIMKYLCFHILDKTTKAYLALFIAIRSSMPSSTETTPYHERQTDWRLQCSVH